MMNRIITSMTRTRFDEFRADILDGSLVQRLSEMGDDEDKLTRSQRVELNQARAIIAIYKEDPDLLTMLVSEPTWKELQLVETDGGAVDLVLKRYRRRSAQMRVDMGNVGGQ